MEWLGRSFAVTAAWVFLAAVICLQLGRIPGGRLEWFLLFITGPPLYVLGEGFFDWVFSPEHRRRISPERFSLIRVLLVLVVLFPMVILALLFSLAGQP